MKICKRVHILKTINWFCKHKPELKKGVVYV